MYFHICFQTTKHIFLNACTKHPLDFPNLRSSIYHKKKKKKKKQNKTKLSVSLLSCNELNK